MSRKQIVIALVALLVVAGAGVGAWFLWGQGASSPAATEQASSDNAPQNTQNSGPTPSPVLVVIDRAAIMQYSKAGQDIGRQVQEFTKQTRSQLDGRVKALESEGNALKREAPGMSPDARQKRVDDFEKKQAALQKVVSDKDAQVKAAVEKGRQAMEKVLAPILKDVTKEHGVNLVLDKQAVLFASTNTFDITPEVIEQLNAKLPSVKIDFTAPPDPKK